MLIMVSVVQPYCVIEESLPPEFIQLAQWMWTRDFPFPCVPHKGETIGFGFGRSLREVSSVGYEIFNEDFSAARVKALVTLELVSIMESKREATWGGLSLLGWRGCDLKGNLIEVSVEAAMMVAGDTAA